MKSKDQKQIDFEELSNYLVNYSAERDRTLNPQRGAGGLASFINSKYQDFRGVDQEKARQDKLIKLASKIQEVCYYL